MFNLFKDKVTDAEIRDLKKRLNALEDYLDVDYFNGPKYKPHFKKRRVKAKRAYTKKSQVEVIVTD